MSKTIVIKVGTSTLLSHGGVASDTFERIAATFQPLLDTHRVVLVTSGAIGFGMKQLEIMERPSEIHHLQALSMIGQVGLLKRWREAFDATTIGQVLVTRRDLESQTPTRLFRESVHSMWEYRALPIINENDAVSTEEISFGDNDRLAAEIAVTLEADILVLLTDQDGIQADFATDKARRLERVSIDDAMQHIAPSASHYGRGGASSKLQAAGIALDSGIDVYIAHAAKHGSLERILSGKTGTKIIK